MKNTLLVMITAFLLTNCNNQQMDNQTTKPVHDTLTEDSSLAKLNRVLINPFRDINNFNITVGNDFIDSVHHAYTNTQATDITLTKDICIGDNCESYQTIVHKDDQSILYYFKGDGGEYGFSNDQYFLQHDSLRFIRNFNVNIEAWPTDTSETVWRVEEVTYTFQPEVVSCIRKTVLTKHLSGFDFTLKNADAEITKVGWAGTYTTKAEELEQQLKRKDSEYRD